MAAIRRMSDVLTHLKLRAAALKGVKEYYEKKESERGLLTDEALAFELSAAQLREVENLVAYIEGE